MKTRSSKKALYIDTLAVGVRDNAGDGPELSMVCRRILPETSDRLNNIASIQVRLAEKEHEISAVDEHGNYLGALLHETSFSELGAVASLRNILKQTSSVNLRLFSMGEPDASITKSVSALFVFYGFPTLPVLVVRAA